MNQLDVKKAIWKLGKEIESLPKDARASKYLEVARLQGIMLRQARNRKSAWQSLADVQKELFPRLPQPVYDEKRNHIPPLELSRQIYNARGKAQLSTRFEVMHALPQNEAIAPNATLNLPQRPITASNPKYTWIVKYDPTLKLESIEFIGKKLVVTYASNDKSEVIAIAPDYSALDK
jgi:hypothetical protein